MSDADTNKNLGFDFAPDWARTSADEYVSRYQDKVYDERTGREERPRREGGFRDRERFSRRDNDRPRPPRREFGDGERRPRRERDNDRPRQEGAAPRAEGDRPFRKPRTDRPPMRREFVKPLDAELRILPNQRNLGLIIKTLQSTHTAYPVKKFVRLFLENPQACLARFEAKPETDTIFWTCKACDYVALTEAEVVAHILATHLGDFFDITQESCDAPSGTFPCVAKCTITNEWVGAPNHHAYHHRVAELAARVGLSEKDYLKKVEMCRDPESIEAWKQTQTVRTVYRLKAAPVEAPAEGEAETAEETRPTYNRDQAEAIFRRDLLPKLVASAKHVCVPVTIAQTSTSASLVQLLKNALRKEQMNPSSLLYALRGAFRHRKFTIFRGNDARGPEFVANVTLTPTSGEHMVRELAEALKYVAEHPLCTRAELLAALRESLADMDMNVVVRQIAFLFAKGHILEYYNGVLALPEATPRFRKLPEEMKRERDAAAEEKAAAPAETVAPEAPAAEAPVEAPAAPAEAEAPVVESESEQA